MSSVLHTSVSAQDGGLDPLIRKIIHRGAQENQDKGRHNTLKNTSKAKGRLMEAHRRNKKNTYCIMESLLAYLFLFYIIANVGNTSAAFFDQGSDSEVASKERYERGKAQYQILKAESKMPKYSKCWTGALEILVMGCKKLDDEMQHRLAVAFTNCFLEKTGRETYPCDQGTPISDCVSPMKSEAYNTYTEFFTHTQNICFFLESQVWQAETQRTVTRLTENSDVVAQQLEDSGILQKEILEKQNDSLANQDILLARGKELRNALEDSAIDVHHMMKELKASTAEQKASLADVFDRIQSLQSLVMGEFTGFYSMVFYTSSLIVSYLLTSTPRTSGARFWLFLLMTLNVVTERLLVSFGASDYLTNDGELVSGSEVVYARLSVCRKTFCVFGMLTLLVIALLFEDINRVNHQLLQTITEQNHQIKHLLQSSAVGPDTRLDESQKYDSPPVHVKGYHSDQVDSAIGYESDSESDATSFDSGTTDHTYKVDDEDSGSEAESFLTSFSCRSSRFGTPTLLEELRGLRDATPQRTITDIPTDISTGTFIPPEVGAGDALTSTPQKRRGRTPGRRTPLNISDVPSPQTRYNLRTRQGTPPVNPVVKAETEKDFGRVVQHLAKVSARNGLKTKYTLDRLRRNERREDSYSTDDL